MVSLKSSDCKALTGGKEVQSRCDGELVILLVEHPSRSRVLLTALESIRWRIWITGASSKSNLLGFAGGCSNLISAGELCRNLNGDGWSSCDCDSNLFLVQMRCSGESEARRLGHMKILATSCPCVFEQTLHQLSRCVIRNHQPSFNINILQPRTYGRADNGIAAPTPHLPSRLESTRRHYGDGRQSRAPRPPRAASPRNLRHRIRHDLHFWQRRHLH